MIADGIPVSRNPAESNAGQAIVFNDWRPTKPAGVEMIIALKDAAAIAFDGFNVSNGVIWMISDSAFGNI